MSDYTPQDSLAYLHSNPLLDVAIEALGEALEGDTDHMDAMQLAYSVIDNMSSIIRYEAMHHSAQLMRHYSTGVPVNTCKEESYREQDTTGVWHIGTREVVLTLHPTGGDTHPVFENGPGAA
jgi:hypothetical protein